MDILRKCELNVLAIKLAKAKNVKNILLEIRKNKSRYLNSIETTYLINSINKITEGEV
jgi:uncharacterized protein YbgA (DUF1722 family)